MKLSVCLALILCIIPAVQGEIVIEVITYNHGEVELEGFLAWDNNNDNKRPGVLVVHEWIGLNDYAKMRYQQLAEMGYVAFAVDMYGKGIRPQSNDEVSKQAGIYQSDRNLMRQWVAAEFEVLLNNEFCDHNRVAAIGYCFGGGTVLELARSGAEIAGVVSFHGNLDTLDPEIAKNMRCKILVCHGADDPHVPNNQVAAFFEEMCTVGVDYQLLPTQGRYTPLQIPMLAMILRRVRLTMNLLINVPGNI